MEEFEAMVRTLGVKLLLAKLRFYGSELKLHMSMTKPWWESVKSGITVINDILFVKVLEQRNPEFANRPHADRKFFIYTPFLPKLKRIYVFKYSDGAKSYHSY